MKKRVEKISEGWFFRKTNKINKPFARLIKEKRRLKSIKIEMREDLQDGRGVRRGDQLPLHKYIKNTSTCGTAPTEHLLNTDRDLRLPKRQETPHIPGCVADRVLVLWLDVRPEPLR